ncbi:MAG: hypothetical protein WCF18_19650 [Chthoniobacteraceae bacterium]
MTEASHGPFSPLPIADYLETLDATKAQYPFQRWADSGLDQYTAEACGAFARIFDTLIEKLSALGQDAPEAQKLESFHQAVIALNVLNEEDESLIETGEREDLCELCNVIAVAAGMDPTKYGEGKVRRVNGATGEVLLSSS